MRSGDGQTTQKARRLEAVNGTVQGGNRLTADFPGEEKFGLVSQMRRAAVSVPSNIAEGAARSSNNEFRNFLSIARSSLSELDTQLDLSEQLGLITEPSRREIDALLIRIDKMLYALYRSKKKVVSDR